MEHLYSTCLGLLLFFSFSLLSKKNKALSEKIFSFWIVILCLTELSFLLYAISLSGAYPLFITVICDSHLLHGALLLLYVQAFTNAKFKLQKVHLWHLLPLALQLFFKLSLNFLFGKMDCYGEGGCAEGDSPYVLATQIFKYLVLGLYIFASWKAVLKFSKQANSPREKMRLSWTKQIVQGGLFLYLGILLLHLGSQLWPEYFSERKLLGNTLASLFVLIFLYIGNSYTYIFVSPSRNRFKNLSENYNATPAKKQDVVSESEQIFSTVDAYMKTHKPFTKGQLTLKDLSQLCEIPSTTLSQVINSQTEKSVTEYINTHRVNLLKEKLSDPNNKNFTILALAEECGFTSKATLGRIFKQHTGLTPSEYLKNIS